MDWSSLETWYKIAGIIGGFVISPGLIWLAWEANAINKSNADFLKQAKEEQQYRITKDEREIFRVVYTKLVDALGLVQQYGRVREDVLTLFWQARDQARVELPEDIAQYTEELLSAANSALIKYENRNRFLPQEEHSKPLDSAEIHMKILYEAKPSQKFAPYLRIKPQIPK